MYDLVMNRTYSLGGKDFVQVQTLSENGLDGVEATVPAAQSGTLTVRTNNTDGTLTMDNAGHGITTASHIDLYWINTDGTYGFRRNATVGTVSGTSVPFTSGSGNNLPASSSVMYAATVQVYTVNITGAEATAICMAVDSTAGQIVLLKTGGTVEVLAVQLSPLQTYCWVSSDPACVSNPITGSTIDTVHITIADITSSRSARMSCQMATS